MSRKKNSENFQTNLKNEKKTIEKKTIEEKTIEEKKDLKNNSPCKWIWDILSGFIEVIRLIITALPAITPLLAALYKYFYTIDAENYYGIEANLLSLEGTVGNTLITLMGSTLLILFVPTLLLYIHKFDHGFNKTFANVLLSLIIVILYIWLTIILNMTIQHHIIFFLIAPVVAFLATIGGWFMYQDDVKDDKSWRYDTIRNIISRIWEFKKAEEKTEECNKEIKKAEEKTEECNKEIKKDEEKTEEYNKKIKKCTLVCAILFILLFISVIYVYSYIVIFIASINIGKLPSQKKNYEIVQMNNDPELNATSEQICSASNFQVVILHRGSQVLLMNGEIDDKTTANLQADMSSSKLWIDTKSYEFQEASQYRFYRKKFKNVTKDKPSNNNQ